MPRVLYVAHNHMSIRPGGMEAYAEELYHALPRRGTFETLFVTRYGPPHSTLAPPAGHRFSLDEEDPDLHYLYTAFDEFDRVLWTGRDKRLYTETWRAFLEVQQPDLVHFHHSLLLGWDIVGETRRTLPEAPIVYHLHDFLAICQNSGQMIRTGTNALCDHATPRRCHECFPAHPPETFRLRERFVKAALAHVDRFITPSRHARKRYIAWGIPAERIIAANYGRIPVAALPDPPDAGRRKRVAFFGRLFASKGVDTLLEAIRLVAERDPEVELVLWGASLDMQSPAFREQITGLLAAAGDSVRFAGSYVQDELPALMSSVDWVIVPSIWWETGPLVIHEALMHNRPVICSDIGSMPERIEDGVNGLHFRVGSIDSLAAAIERAVGDPALWDRLRAGITPPHTMDDHLVVIDALYRELLAGRKSGATA